MNFLKSHGEDSVLITEEEQRRLAAETIDETGIPMDVKGFLEAVSRYKSGLTEVQEEDKSQEGLLRQAFRIYEEKKDLRKLWDFDDLLLRTAERIEDVSEGWERQFRYLLVDEFQDINPAQFRLVKLWSRAGRELFVIGDPDQSIYGFRGADAECFEKLKKEYNDLEVIRLRENYRSSPQILSAALEVISQGEKTDAEQSGEKDDGQRGGRMLHPNCPDGLPVRLIRTGSPTGEAVFIAKEIGRLVGGIGMLEAHEAAWKREDRGLRGFGEIAVLCRTHHQAELVEKCLKRESIPYIAAGREDFLTDRIVQESICFFRYLEKQQDPVSVKSCNSWSSGWKRWGSQTALRCRSSCR